MAATLSEYKFVSATQTDEGKYEYSVEYRATIDNQLDVTRFIRTHPLLQKGKPYRFGSDFDADAVLDNVNSISPQTDDTRTSYIVSVDYKPQTSGGGGGGGGGGGAPPPNRKLSVGVKIESKPVTRAVKIGYLNLYYDPATGEQQQSFIERLDPKVTGVSNSATQQLSALPTELKASLLLGLSKTFSSINIPFEKVIGCVNSKPYIIQDPTGGRFFRRTFPPGTLHCVNIQPEPITAFTQSLRINVDFEAEMEGFDFITPDVGTATIVEASDGTKTLKGYRDARGGLLTQEIFLDGKGTKLADLAQVVFVGFKYKRAFDFNQLRM